MRHQLFGLSLVLLAMGFALTASATVVPEDIINDMQQAVAVEYDIAPDQLEFQDLRVVDLPLTGVVLYRAKLVDLTTGDAYQITLDASGSEADLRGFQQAEAAAYRAKYGNLRPDLHDKVAQAGPNEVFEVGIWLISDEIAPLERPEVDNPTNTDGSATLIVGLPTQKGEMIESDVPADQPTQAEQQFRADNAVIQAGIRAMGESLRIANVAHLSQQSAQVRQDLVQDLRGFGFEPTYVSETAPLVFAALPASVIQLLSDRVDIDAIYPRAEYTDAMNTVKPTHKADVVDSTFGFEGDGIDLAILEDSRIQFNNPYLVNGVTRVPGDANVDQHATATAGMAASQHSTYQGIAQGAALFSANGTTYGAANISAAMDWAATTSSVDIINNSWGGNDGNTDLNEHDRHLDYIVRNLWPTVTVAAGNTGNASGRVGSPARAYNVISVGNHADQGTVTWDDDAMASSSSYIDPSTGCEKPEVAASGSSITSTTDVAPWTGNVGSGTSYSAPMVAGEAALLMQRSSTLTNLPEAVKAITMATALHNIEGSSRLSEYDGAGSVDMRAAFRVVDEGWWQWNSVDAGNFPYSFNYQAHEGETVRAVIAWDSNPNGSYTTDPLDADIDLTVFTSGGIYVTGSSSFNNSSEIVEFVAAATDTYEFRITEFRFDGGTEYVGFAFWPGHEVLAPYDVEVRGTPPVSRDHFVVETSGYWNAVGIRSPAGANFDILLYDGSAFGDPADHIWLEDSTLAATGGVDFVVIDGNHAPSKEYFLENRASSGTGSYPTEWGNRITDTEGGQISDAGAHGPYSMTATDVLRVFDSDLTAGVRKYFALKPTGGDADLGIALYDSDPSTSATWYQGLNQTVAWSDSGGSGDDEFFNYQTSTTDWHGLVVFNNGATSTTSFMLYTDTTAPTGSIAINGGAATTNSLSVTVDLSVTDPETEPADMRWSWDGSTYQIWFPYSTSQGLTFAHGGFRTIWFEVRNNAGMSEIFTDSIFIDTTGSAIFIDNFESGTTGAWDSTFP